MDGKTPRPATNKMTANTRTKVLNPHLPSRVLCVDATGVVNQRNPRTAIVAITARQPIITTNHEKCPAWLDALFTNVIAFDAVFPEPFGAVVAEIDEEHDLDEQKHCGTKCLGMGDSVIGFMHRG